MPIQRKTRVRLIVVLSCVVGALVALELLWLYLSGSKRIFEMATHLAVPRNAVVTEDDSHETGPFDTDGVRGIAMTVDRDTVQSWLAQHPFAPGVE